MIPISEKKKSINNFKQSMSKRAGIKRFPFVQQAGFNNGVGESTLLGDGVAFEVSFQTWEN